MIAIIDYGSGNIQSVKNALDSLGEISTITSSPQEVEKADKVIFPGVGSFGFAMKRLEQTGLDKAILESIKQNKPFLGICLGLQLLLESSDESPEIKGLSVLKGKCLKFQNGKVPQIGWNEIIPTPNSIFKRGYAYFVNSYYVVPDEKSIISTTSYYNGQFTSSIQSKNITAVQFHPEKSGDFGLEFLKRWANAN